MAVQRRRKCWCRVSGKLWVALGRMDMSIMKLLFNYCAVLLIMFELPGLQLQALHRYK